jgi:uncharacterized membrane protein
MVRTSGILPINERPGFRGLLRGERMTDGVIRMEAIRLILLCAHVLAGAAWFGGMLYSLILVHPRAKSFFRNPRNLEEFIVTLAAGARWKVLGGCIIIAVTGLGLLGLPSLNQKSAIRLGCMVAKTVLFVIAVSFFCHVSWKLWPARVLASDDEIPRYQRRFRYVAITLLALVALCMALGILGAHS